MSVFWPLNLAQVSYRIFIFTFFIPGLILRIPVWNQPKEADQIMEDAEYWLLPDEEECANAITDNGHHFSSNIAQPGQVHVNLGADLGKSNSNTASAAL